MPDLAFIEVRVFPWRPRRRTKVAGEILENVGPSDMMPIDDLSGILIGIAWWLIVLVAAPVLIAVIAALLFSIELPLLVVLALLIVVARLCGVIPWTVATVDPKTHVILYGRTRSLLRAMREVRAVTGGPVPVRWKWV